MKKAIQGLTVAADFRRRQAEFGASPTPQQPATSNKQQATSNKQQATSDSP